MNEVIFKKMRLKEGAKGEVLYIPKEYEEIFSQQTYVQKAGEDEKDFVLFFAESLEEYNSRIPEALRLAHAKTAIWIGYKKSKGKIKYDINRDILFSITPKDSLQLNGNIALDDTWSLVRAKIVP